MDMDELPTSKSPKEDASLHHPLTLRTAPSFDIYYSSEGFADGDKDAEEVLQRTIAIGQSIQVLGSGQFSFGNKEMDLIEEEGESDKDDLDRIRKLGLEEEVEPASPAMYLASGLGIDGTGFGFDSFPIDDLCLPNLDGSGNFEDHYKRMIDDYPCHPLILRNYAQILQSKGDLHGAEEYFLRATLVDPNNGEILMQYAKLVWDLHRDKQRALEYFERAAQASSPDSHVLAAYANFLWEIEDADGDGDEEGGKHDTNSKNENNEQKIKSVSPPKQDDKDTDVEEYHRKMIDENPSNPLFLKSYAQFLIQILIFSYQIVWQSKGDLHGAGECLSRVILTDPGDGKILMQYAQLVWELHQDKDKALTYFERAAQVAPLDSDVQAAYASFLWEIEDDEEEGGKQQSNSEEKEEQEHHIRIVKGGKIENDEVHLTLANRGKDGDIEDYSKKMIDENPNDPYFLKTYAQFLIQSKKDLQAAEKYYSRAILVNPGDGEMISEYAKLEWQLHHDWRKALSYFEQAVEASPEDSNVLAAYACFLWEAEDVEAEISE
ncbi:hypothetical protein QN277_027174 [Acacia crassicarpa]|uniref:Uncharacterized protein n=1 Tax=Acacia crassicarpa TaxID=499986 RepID=A0AAE1JCG5_9FABA|nr:hypothetical protein QN277_027174 [Acacia crassicarpa]